MPVYQDFRAELDRLFPDFSDRVAVRDTARSERDLRGIFNDASAQVDPRLVPHLRETLRAWSRQMPPESEMYGLPSSPLFMAVTNVFNGAVAGGYINTMAANDNATELAKALGGPRYPLERAKQVDSEMLGWFVFYHELGHARVRVGGDALSRAPGTLRNRQAEETLCDSFAALCLLSKFGARAVPVIHELGEMRLLKSRSMSGHSPRADMGAQMYHTGPLLKYIAENITDEEIGELRHDDGENLYKIARANMISYMRSAESDLPRPDFAVRRPQVILLRI